MKIPLTHFKKNRYDLALSYSDPWLAAIFLEQIKDRQLIPESVRGELHLIDTEGNVALMGNLDFEVQAQCARCGEPLKRREHLLLNAQFTPASALKLPPTPRPTADEEEIELTEDDLNFCLYNNDEILIAPYISDEITLSLPYNYYCRDESACQKRLESSLKAKTAPNTDLRWAAFKNIKFRDS